MKFIDLQSQYVKYKSEIQDAINRVLDSSQYIMGPEVQYLESELADYVGVKHAIACSSGTDALVLALMSREIGPGDEVIVPAFSFVATASSVALVGATPVFVDVCESDFNLDIEQVESKISSKTKAVIVVGLYGLMPDMRGLKDLCSSKGLVLIEDGAQSFGSKRAGLNSLQSGDMGCTSFFPAKPLGAYGDGGAIFTDWSDTANILRALLNHGSEIRYQHNRLGINGRLDAIQAAVLRVKLAHYDEELELREKVASYYSSKLSGFEGVTVPVKPDSSISAWAQYTLRVIDRDKFVKQLGEAGIPTAVHYPSPLHTQPIFSHLGYEIGDLPVSEKLCKEVVSLPMSPFISKAELDQVVLAIKSGGSFIHKTAEISADISKIGAGSKIWKNVHVREGVTVGENTIVSKDVYLDKDVKVGSNCKIQNGVSVYCGVEIGDDVFIGPSVTFTNDKVPRAFNEGWRIVETRVEKGASIGANSTIVCGVRLGKYCMVGAGSVVTKDIGDYELVVGNPAKVVGKVDKMGHRIEVDDEAS